MTNEVPRDDPRFGKRIGEGVRELERRLLVVTKEVHTATGAHAKLVCSWERWLKQAGPLETGWDCHSAKQEFERIVVGLNRKHGVNARLPWS